jgi:hypothetical protein
MRADITTILYNYTLHIMPLMLLLLAISACHERVLVPRGCVLMPEGTCHLDLFRVNVMQGIFVEPLHLACKEASSRGLGVIGAAIGVFGAVRAVERVLRRQDLLNPARAAVPELLFVFIDSSSNVTRRVTGLVGAARQHFIAMHWKLLIEHIFELKKLERIAVQDVLLEGVVQEGAEAAGETF